MDTCSDDDDLSIPCEPRAIVIHDGIKDPEKRTELGHPTVPSATDQIKPVSRGVEQPNSTYVQGIGEDRSQSASWSLEPQCVRGITLGELKAFCAERYDWLAQLRWRCAACGRGCARASCECTSVTPNEHEACIHCGSVDGSLSMRNLYEVMDEMIKPRCAQQEVSYVELLTSWGFKSSMISRVPYGWGFTSSRI